MPERIQLRRIKGYRKPPEAVVVARPTKWGNPFAVGSQSRGLIRYGPRHEEKFGRPWDYEGRISADGTRHDMWFAKDNVIETYVRFATRAEVVELFRLTLFDPTPGMLMAYPSNRGRFLDVTVDDIRSELAGRDLACWCSLDQPCHADVLLALASGRAEVAAEMETCGRHQAADG